MQHLYTDDELVALAASASVRWTGPLPTLAIEESDELVRAAIRGARALAVRRATDPGAGGEQIRSLVRQSEAARTAVMFLIDADGASVPPCDVSTFFLLGSDEVLEDRVSAAGVHGFRVLNRPRLHQLLGDVVSEVIASGVRLSSYRDRRSSTCRRSGDIHRNRRRGTNRGRNVGIGRCHRRRAASAIPE